MSTSRAILLTPPGVAAIAVIRITGEGVGPFLDRYFSKRAIESRCIYGQLRDDGHVLDDIVVVLLPNDRGADLNVHGGSWVVESILQLLAREQFEVQRATEMPLVAEAVDAESILEEEVLMHLPLARTREAIAVLLAQPNAWQAYRENPGKPPSVADILDDRSLDWMLHPPRLAIVGAANVGKSTLANQLFAQERSITADIAGTTRDWVGESTNLDGLLVTLMDTPGLRQTADAIEADAIKRSAEQIEKADLILLVLDASRDLSEQMALVSQFPKALLVLNKMDRPMRWIDRFPATLGTIATSGQGVDELRMAIRRHFGCASFEADRPRWWTLRQREILGRAVTNPSALAEM